MTLPLAASGTTRDRVRWACRAFWRFARPHTVIGTSLSVLGIAVLVGVRPGFPPAMVPAGALATTWLAAIGANLYIVGLNQIRDVAVDRVNKPRLPIPAGLLSPTAARRLVGAALGMALVAGAMGGGWLLATVAAGMIMGTAYSLPPMHLKRHAIPAALAIALVRGPVVNLGLFAHISQALGRPAAPSPAILWLTAFMTIYALGIAVAKDVPDVDGDRRFSFGTYAVRVGPRRAHGLSLAILAGAYLLVIGAAISGKIASEGPTQATLAGIHVAGLAVLIGSGVSVRATDGPRIERFYRRVWRLFYAEYVLFPAAVFVGAVAG